MKFIADRHVLLESMNRLNLVASKQKSIPILSHVLLEASDNNLKLTATDMDTTMSETIPVKLETPGSITTPAQKFLNIIKATPEGLEITVETNGNTQTSINLLVESNAYRFSIMTISADEFPAESYDQPKVPFTLNAKDLAFLIDTTEFAVSGDSSRVYLNGVFLDPLKDQNILRAVGTNGHQMAISEIPLPPSQEPIPSVIIPQKVLKLISQLTKLAPEDNTPFHIEISSHQIHIHMESIHLFSRLIDDKYPNYQQVIPQDNNKNLTLSKQDLDKSVEAVAIIANDHKTSIKISLSENEVTISARSQNQETADVNIPAQYNHENLSIGFNGAYLLGILQHCPQDNITIQLKDPQSPILIHTPHNARFILMPVKV